MITNKYKPLSKIAMSIPPRKFKASITALVQLSPTVISITFKPVDFPDFTFEAGQFVMLSLPDEAGNENKRAFSIASPPHEAPEFRLCIKVHQGGKVSGRIGSVPVGGLVDFHGPFGKFVLHKPLDKETMFVAGGTGIAPLYSMIADLLHTNTQTDIALFFSFREPYDYLYAKNLEQLADKHSNFKVYTTLTSRTASVPGWCGSRGRICELLMRIIKSPRDKSVYICGPKEFIDASRETLVQIGIPSEKIFVEQW
ncbi:FAD-dependent oxidoreductase [Candidatus Woesearchaeota archaeon]|nr:FAD-dependent oxidoreductase [Candidatus Woesearchaeota archaeon]